MIGKLKSRIVTIAELEPFIQSLIIESNWVHIEKKRDCSRKQLTYKLMIELIIVVLVFHSVNPSGVDFLMADDLQQVAGRWLKRVDEG